MPMRASITSPGNACCTPRGIAQTPDPRTSAHGDPFRSYVKLSPGAPSFHTATARTDSPLGWISPTNATSPRRARARWRTSAANTSGPETPTTPPATSTSTASCCDSAALIVSVCRRKSTKRSVMAAEMIAMTGSAASLESCCIDTPSGPARPEVTRAPTRATTNSSSQASTNRPAGRRPRRHVSTPARNITAKSPRTARR